MTLRELMMGGPGHDGYAYYGDVYCVECGRDAVRVCYPAVKDDDLAQRDSERMPQPIFFGESPDCAQHCGECGEYLYGPQEEETEEPEGATADDEWWIENKHSGAGDIVNGTFDDACRAALERCTTDSARWVVWVQPANARAAEVTMRGVEWRAPAYR